MVAYIVNNISLTDIHPAPNTVHEQYALDGVSRLRVCHYGVVLGNPLSAYIRRPD